MEISRNKYGRVSWTLRDGKWVRPETGEVDSREPQWTGAPGLSLGARPRPGENCYKPSESLLRDLNRVQDDTAKAAAEKRRERAMEVARELDAGKIRVAPDVTMRTPHVRIQQPDGSVDIVAADKAPEVVAAREAEERAAVARANAPMPAGAQEFRAGDGERVWVSDDATGAIRPTVPQKALDQGAFLSWSSVPNEPNLGHRLY